MNESAERLSALADKYDAFKEHYRKGSATYRWYVQHIADLRAAAQSLKSE